jgi:hypothetical protein
MGKASALSFSGFSKAINIVHPGGPTQKLTQNGSWRYRSVHLRPQLAIVHNLKKRMLRGSRDEPRAPLRIFPNHSEFSGKSRARGCGLEGRVGIPLVGFRKCDQ